MSYSSPSPFSMGAWIARSINTTYLAASDIILVAYGEKAATELQIIGKSDGSTPPTTTRIIGTSPSAEYACITFPVREGDYWRIEVTAPDNFTIYEIALT